MNYYPFLYEINTRVWLRQFDTPVKKATLADVPSRFWDQLAAIGINYVWLMGIWQTNKETIKKYCYEEDLIKEYANTLKDWKDDDVIGSPYAINDYIIDENAGTAENLVDIKWELNKRGIKLILDFIPNHFSAATPLIKTNPEVFLEADETYITKDPHTFFIPFADDKKVFAHGRDPFFPAWQDTIQVNYSNKAARDFMTKKLIYLSYFCDGVRCDVAMLALNNIFCNTWGSVISNKTGRKLKTEFWEDAIKETKNIAGEFIFIAEAYWDLEWNLQQLGFDFTYDKRLTDRLKYNNIQSIKEHLTADLLFQNKLVRFLENHDEERTFTALGKERTQAAAVIAYTIPGLRFFYDGQLTGKRIKLPLQLGREPKEDPITCITEFYNNFFAIINNDVFKKGDWKLITPFTTGGGDKTNENILAWAWAYKEENFIVTINYSSITSVCRIRFNVPEGQDDFVIRDLLNKTSYIRSVKETNKEGLFIKLQPYKAHIFKY